VWICGDCHVGNLGPVADTKGSVDIQVRDLDQTVIGNPAHDLIRLGLSLASAGRGSNLPGITTAHLLEAMVHGYEQAFESDFDEDDPGIEPPSSVRLVMKLATKRRWKQLARERLEDTKPTIPLGRRFWPVSDDEISAITKLVESEPIHELATMVRSRDDDAEVELLDAAYWMKGCSSLGRLRFAALLSVDGEYCLLDLKEAVDAAAPSYPDVTVPTDEAERVVEGARHIAPALGNRMRACHLLDRSVFVRELLPQDLKVEIEQLTVEDAVQAAEFLASVVGHAHARQMDTPTRRQWQSELGEHRSRSLDAPSWL
jgi:uncharacterized protein (DUF2252 family)